MDALSAALRVPGIDPDDGLTVIPLDALVRRPVDPGMALLILPPTGRPADPDEAEPPASAEPDAPPFLPAVLPGRQGHGTDPLTQKWLNEGELAEFYQKVPKDKTVYLYCHDGFRMSLGWLQLYALGYQDIRLLDGGWGVWDRAFTLPVTAGVSVERFSDAARGIDPRRYAFFEGQPALAAAQPAAAEPGPATVTSYGNSEVWIDGSSSMTARFQAGGPLLARKGQATMRCAS